jgi:hypothetical protein
LFFGQREIYKFGVNLSNFCLINYWLGVTLGKTFFIPGYYTNSFMLWQKYHGLILCTFFDTSEIGLSLNREL